MSNWNLTIQKMEIARKKERAKPVPVSPAQTLKFLLANFNINANTLALNMRVPPNRVYQILKGTRNITAETAMRLGKVFREDPKHFLSIQMEWDLYEAEQADRGRIDKEVKELCI